MKAIICTKYGDPDVLQLREIEKPIPKAREILIKMHATSVTASDTIVRGFKISRWHPLGFMMGMVLGFKAPRQAVLGMIVSGEVVETGDQVQRFKKGDAVFGWAVHSPIKMRFGAYAEYMCLSESAKIITKPDKLSFEEAAAIPYGGMMAQAFLKMGKIEQANKVLIYGASGAIGTATLQLAKSHGAEVTAVCSSANHQLVKSLGADHLIDYTEPNCEVLLETYDLVFDAVGDAKTSRLKTLAQKALTPKGKYLSVDKGSPAVTTEAMQYLKEKVEQGLLKPIIDRRYPLEEMAIAHRYVDAGHKKGEVIINIQ